MHRLQRSLQEREKQVFSLEKHSSSITQRMEGLEETLKASSDQMAQIQDVHATEMDQQGHLLEQELEHSQTEGKGNDLVRVHL